MMVRTQISSSGSGTTPGSPNWTPNTPTRGVQVLKPATLGNPRVLIPPLLLLPTSGCLGMTLTGPNRSGAMFVGGMMIFLSTIETMLLITLMVARPDTILLSPGMDGT